MKAHASRDRTAQHRTCADSGLDARVLRCRWRHRARDTSVCNSKAPCAAPSTSSLNALHRVSIPWRRSPPRTRKLSQRIAGSHSRVPSSVTTQAHQCDPFQQTAQRLSPGLPDRNRVTGRRASPILGRFGDFLRCLSPRRRRSTTWPMAYGKTGESMSGRTIPGQFKKLRENRWKPVRWRTTTRWPASRGISGAPPSAGAMPRRSPPSPLAARRFWRHTTICANGPARKAIP